MKEYEPSPDPIQHYDCALCEKSDDVGYDITITAAGKRCSICEDCADIIGVVEPYELFPQTINELRYKVEEHAIGIVR